MPKLDTIILEALTNILFRLGRIETLGAHLNTQIQAFQTAVTSAFADISTSLDNIVSDEATQAAQILTLQQAIANNPSSTLAPEDQAALDSIAQNALTLAAKVKAAADSIPETVPVPAPVDDQNA